MPDKHLISVSDENLKIKQRLDRLAWVLDSVIPLPFGYRIGLDGLIGIFPVVGDFVTALLSSYVIGEGVRNNAPKSVIAKMIANLLLDTLLGAIPVLGDLFDIAHRANYKNVNLLRGYLDEPVEVKRKSQFWIIGVLISVLAIIAMVMWAIISVLSWLAQLF